MSKPLNDSLFQSAFNHAAIGMALVSPEGYFLKVNTSLCDIVGYPAHELLAKTFQEITHPDDLDLDLNNLRQLSEGAIQSYRMEKRYFHKEGQTISVLLSVSASRHPDGSVEFYISQIEDITARKEAENFREILFKLPLTLHFVIGTDGVFKRLSPGWYASLGYKESELIGKAVLDFVHPDDVDRTVSEAESLSQGKSSFLFENRFRCADGSYRWLLWASIPVPEQQQICGVAIDFTTRKALELNLRLALEDRDGLIKELESSARQVRNLRDKLVTICAWTNRVFHDGRWMSTDEFLGDYLGLHLTHGISEEGKALFFSPEPGDGEDKPEAEPPKRV